jgi:O-antigen/teichoic acid export membrane protein
MTVEAKNIRHLTSGHLLARNTIWNLSASAASILIALFSVPILLRYLGADRFGIISLIWIVEGQFGIFDIGLSQALTKLVAEKLGIGKDAEIPSIFWGCLAIMAAFGLVGSVLLRILSPWLAHSALRVPVHIQPETVESFYYVAISLPVVISSAGLRGFLAAYQRFDLLNMVRVPISLFSYLVPLLVLPFSKKLGPFVLVLVASRFASWLLHLFLCLRISPALRHNFSLKGAPYARMFTFGGWMTVTNLVSPIMVNMDRLLIGGLISVAAVAYYATSYEAATKLWIIPSAITGVLFPAFATALTQDRHRAALLFDKAMKYIFLALAPIVLAVLALGHWALQLWLGAAFSDKSTIVLQLLVLGVFANSLAQVPFWQIQAANRPDLSAKVHLIELPLYLCAFWWLTKTFGINGAGIAWMLRSSLDAIVMFCLSGRLLVESWPSVRRLAWMTAAAVPVFAIAVLIESHVLAFGFVAAVCLIFAAVAWQWVLTEQERGLALDPVQFFRYKHTVAVGGAENAAKVAPSI